MVVAFRYVARELVLVFAITFVTLLAVALGGRFIGYLQDAALGRYSADALLTLIALRLPEFVQLTVPFAFFVAVLLTWGRLHAEREFAVLLGGGASPRRMLGWVCAVALPVGGGGRVPVARGDPGRGQGVLGPGQRATGLERIRGDYAGYVPRLRPGAARHLCAGSQPGPPAPRGRFHGRAGRRRGTRGSMGGSRQPVRRRGHGQPLPGARERDPLRGRPRARQVSASSPSTGSASAWRGAP